MQKLHSVITAAVKDYGEKLAEIYGLSVGRLYQILEADFYGKTRRLIRALAAIDKDRVRIIKADLDALFTELLCDGQTKEVDCAFLHSELNDVIQARLKGLSRPERLRECWEAKAALDLEIESLREKEEITVNVFGDVNGSVNIKTNGARN